MDKILKKCQNRNENKRKKHSSWTYTQIAVTISHCFACNLLFFALRSCHCRFLVKKNVLFYWNVVQNKQNVKAWACCFFVQSYSAELHIHDISTNWIDMHGILFWQCLAVDSIIFGCFWGISLCKYTSSQPLATITRINDNMEYKYLSWICVCLCILLNIFGFYWLFVLFMALLCFTIG